MDCYFVSKCLLGENCKYNGKNNYNQKVIDFLKDKKYVSGCPEMLGGLPSPRYPSEIKDGKVINSNNEDVTFNFLKGSKEALKIVNANGCNKAILKANSPSCGVGKIYDGSFQGKLIEGNGIFANDLLAQKVEVFSELDFDSKND